MVYATNSSPVASQAVQMASVFAVTAFAEQGTLIRVLSLFAVRDLVPRFVSCVPASDMLRIEVVVYAAGVSTEQVLAAKIRQIVGVTEVVLTRGPMTWVRRLWNTASII